MMIGGKIAELSAYDDVPLKEYNHCLAKIICNPPQPDCYFQNYNSCPGITGLKEHLYALMDDNMIDTIHEFLQIDQHLRRSLSLLMSL